MAAPSAVRFAVYRYRTADFAYTVKVTLHRIVQGRIGYVAFVDVYEALWGYAF